MDVHYFSVGQRKPWYPRVMAGGLEGDSFVGKKADEYRGLLRLRYPVEHGIVKDWAAMEAIWNYTYNELRCSPEEVKFDINNYRNLIF